MTMPSRHEQELLHIHLVGRGSEVWIVLDGELDMATAAQLHKAVYAVLDDGKRPVIEANGLRFIDCAGIDVLVQSARRMAPEVAPLVIRNPSAMFRRLLVLVGLDGVFSLVDEPAW